MVIRKAGIGDRDYILSANIEVNKVSGLSDESALSKNYEKDLLSRSPKFKCYVAEIDKTLVGYVAYSYVYWLNKGRGVYISNIYVSPEYRKRGIMSALIDYLISHEKEINFLTCLVGKENKIMQRALKKLCAENVKLDTYYLRA